MRGLRVALVEQHDFAFGTSSRSSRLLHGGLRYLAQGRVGLVREASIEKKVIHHIAPHLAEPLPFIFPVYRGNRDWRLWQLKIGVKVYDLLCGGRNLGKSSWLSAGETTAKVTGLRDAALNGAVRYYDGFTNDARLVIDTLRSAAKGGAMVLNYCRFEDAEKQQDLWQCRVQDLLEKKALTVSARVVVNATGPWADGLSHSRVKLRLTKGVHLVVDRNRVPVPETVVMTEGKRILFAIPWGERTILGTTDTDYDGSVDEVRSDRTDFEYVLRIANYFFPNASLGLKDVISSWAGLRPLVADPNGNPSEISRSHEIDNPEPGWWDVSGGKLTTYRLMAEQTVDKVVAELEKLQRSEGLQKLQEFLACRTSQEELLPESETKGISAIVPVQPDRRVVEHFCQKEWAIHLDDVMLRRSGWHYYRRDASELARRVADWMGELLGWSKEQQGEEIAAYQGILGAATGANGIASSGPKGAPIESHA